MNNTYTTIADSFTEAPRTTERAVALNFEKGSARRTVWIPKSHSHFDGAKLEVANWLLDKDLGAVIKGGYKLANANLLIIPSNDVSIVPRSTPAQTLQTAEGLPIETNTIFEEAIIKKGFFTVVNVDGSHRTFRVKTNPRGNKRTVIGLLVGPNNTSNYVYFAYVNGSNLQFFGRNPYNRETMTNFWEVIKQDPTAYGRKYALESKQCCRCNKELTTPESINNPRGLGPICDQMPNAFA